jgi:nitrogen regulatory protein PII
VAQDSKAWERTRQAEILAGTATTHQQSTASTLTMREKARTMKVITAIVKQDKLDDLIHAATEAGARGLTVAQVHGFGQQYGHTGPVQPVAQKALMLPKLRIDILTTDCTVEQITEAIAKSVNTGVIGDGKIWVCPVETALRVRTGERDWEAV